MGRPFIPLLVIALIASCSRQSPIAKSEDTLRIAIDGRDALVLVAADAESMGRGLMFVKDLSAVDGMLFLYDEPQVANFWMKNTPLPLTLAYIDGDGIIFQIEYLEPYDTVTQHWSTKPIKYALELKRGWLRERGLGMGSKVDLGKLNKPPRTEDIKKRMTNDQ